MAFLSENSTFMLGTGFMENGWRAARVYDYMPESLKTAFVGGLSSWYDSLLRSELNNPFGAHLTGKSVDAIEMGVRLAVLYQSFPETVDFNYILSATNYMLGNHMANSAAWIHGGDALRVRAEGYGPNRADRFFVGGGIVNGYVEALPGFPEATDNYALMQTQTSYNIASAAKWVVLANSVNKYISYDANFDGAISASIANRTNEPVSGYAVAAVYGANGILEETVLEKFEVDSNKNWRCIFEIDISKYPLESHYYKVFFWDDNYVPLTEAFEYGS